MHKEMILLEPVEGLGAAGDIVRVAPGYARNYLAPKGKAVDVTPAAQRRIEAQRRERETRVAREHEALQALAERLAKSSCTITVKTGPDGKLFGSVSAADIVENLKAQGLEIDRRQVLMKEPFHEVGVFKVGVRLHPEVETALRVWIVEDKG